MNGERMIHGEELVQKYLEAPELGLRVKQLEEMAVHQILAALERGQDWPQKYLADPKIRRALDNRNLLEFVMNYAPGQNVAVALAKMPIQRSYHFYIERCFNPTLVRLRL